MRFNKGMPGSLALLALLASGTALGSAERPQLKNYASYTDFLRAVVDYTRGNDETRSAAGEQQCRDTESGSDGQSTEKQNNCRQKEAVFENNLKDTGGLHDPDAAPPEDFATDQPAASPDNPDSAGNTGTTGNGNDGSGAGNTASASLEQAVAQARDGLNPNYVDPSNTRTTFNSFPMQPIDAGDLAQVSLIDALTGLMVTTRDSRIRLNIDPSQLTNPMAVADTRQAGDNLTLDLNTLEFQQNLLANIFGFSSDIVWSTDGNYYSFVSATPSYLANNGIGIEFSTRASVRMAIVDSDGWISSVSPSVPAAGAVVIDPLNITTNTIVASLFAVDDHNGGTGVLATLDVKNGIDVDLSNVQVGVAGAVRNSSGGWNIGQVNNFLYFGADSKLSITMNTPMEVLLRNPDSGTNTPLMKINGQISNLSLNDISLMDSDSGGGIHFGRMAITNLAMINTSVYFENNQIRVDMGSGLSNMRMVIENIVLGGSLQDRKNGTLPPAIGDAEINVNAMSDLQMTMRAH